MAENKPEQEPSIEEILASIRQIISDEEDPAKEPGAKPVDQQRKLQPEPMEAPEPEPEEPEDHILELTPEMAEEDEDDINLDDYEVAMEESPDRPDFAIDADNRQEPEIKETMEMEQEQEDSAAALPPSPQRADENFTEIISEEAKAAALSSMAKLAGPMPISRPAPAPRAYDGVTLEDIVRDLLHPMLREWMDDNLPPMVERLVQKELEKLARRAMDE